jgi:hypothetical protein
MIVGNISLKIKGKERENLCDSCHYKYTLELCKGYSREVYRCSWYTYSFETQIIGALNEEDNVGR